MTDRYILEGKEAKPCEDLIEWAKWFENADRKVALDIIGNIRISTIFLALDHSFGEDGKPVLFETMVFTGDESGDMDRYFTWDEAVIGHKKMVEKVKGEKND